MHLSVVFLRNFLAESDQIINYSEFILLCFILAH